MFERESNGKTESPRQLPQVVLDHFSAGNQSVESRSVLPWGEHCTECAMPHCFKTCSLYSPREDGKCRRFVNGMVRIDVPGAFNGYILKIEFKKWGKLWTNANAFLFTVDKARGIEKRDRVGAALIRMIPRVAGLRNLFRQAAYELKKRWAARLRARDRYPDFFLLEVFNPQSQSVDLTLTIRPEDEQYRLRPFQKLVTVENGFSRVEIPFEEIASVVDVHAPFEFDITPNDVDGDTLYFGAIDFVRDTAVRPEDSTKIKCVVWDLDNTLWHGVLTEDDPEGLRLRDGVSDIIKQLDTRGILQSVSSKNDEPDALAVLRRLGVEEYFLYPKISWGPKSQAISQIAKDLNIGMDSFLFVDDSAFERAEVEANCPTVRTFDSTDLGGLLQLPALLQKPTPDGRRRREMYRVNMERQATEAKFNGEYFEFLRHCETTLQVRPLKMENIDRVHELVQRTNQLNFSGNRYERDDLLRLMNDQNHTMLVVDGRDRFGDYGTVGFCMIDDESRTMIDMVFSCRVQSKRVEHALLTHVLRRYMASSSQDFFVKYRSTSRNARAGKVFDDFALEVAEEAGELRLLVFRAGREVPDDQLVRVEFDGGGILHGV